MGVGRCSCCNKLASEYRRSMYSQTTILRSQHTQFTDILLYATPNRITRLHLLTLRSSFIFLPFNVPMIPAGPKHLQHMLWKLTASKCMQLEQLATFKLYLSSSQSVLLTSTQPVHIHPTCYKFTIYPYFRLSVIIRYFTCTCDLSTLYPTLVNIYTYVYFVLLVITYYCNAIVLEILVLAVVKCSSCGHNISETDFFSRHYRRLWPNTICCGALGSQYGRPERHWQEAFHFASNGNSSLLKQMQ
jgi:hypothetical protein